MLEIEQTQVPASWQQCLDELAKGEKVVVTDGTQPIAELAPVAKPAAQLRPIGLAAGMVKLEPNCFDPLPDDVLAAFYGGELP
jgi:antitoxin (DNA-binding transcriptional repressor) of toxin-antitoxin stability system